MSATQLAQQICYGLLTPAASTEGGKTVGTTVCKNTLAAKNFGEFGESQAIRQSFFHQFSKSIS